MRISDWSSDVCSSDLEIDFSRRYPQIIAAAGQTVIEADKRLLPLFARTFSQAQFLPEKLDAKADSERQDCDLHLPAGNLLQYFPLTEEEVALKKYPEDDIDRKSTRLNSSH